MLRQYFVAGWLVCWWAWMADFSYAQRVPRPNIVLIVAHELAASDLGCYGAPQLHTPHIDSIARDGLRFTQFYSGSPISVASRCALLTGLHPGHGAIRAVRDAPAMEDLRAKYDWQFPGQEPLPQTSLTFTRLLQDAGYKIAGIGQWGLGQVGTSGDPVRHGFDLFYGQYCQEHARQPYPSFLWRGDRKEVLEGNDGSPAGKSLAHNRLIEESLNFIQNQRHGPFLLCLSLTIPHPAQHGPKTTNAERLAQMDNGVGAILQTLEESKLADKTIVLFTSSCGSVLIPSGQSGLADSSSYDQSLDQFATLREPGLRVPLIVRWPGKVVAGQSTQWLGAHWDFFPTLCELAGLNVPAQIDGLSFAPLLRGEKQDPHEFLVWESPEAGGQQAARRGNWKAVRRMLLSADPDKLSLELYDLAADPDETTNVAAQHLDIVEEFKVLLREQHSPSPLFPLPLID